MAISTEAKVGFVFFIGLAILAIYTIVVGQGELRFHQRAYTIDVVFDSVGGLRKNDSVELGGMEVGKVESLKIQDEKIRVRLRIDEGVELKRDCKIIILDKSILGGKVVSFTMGSPHEETISPGTALSGECAPGATELIAATGKIGQKFEATLQELQKAMPELTSTLQSMNRIVKQIEEGKGILGKLITEEKLAEKLEKTIEGMEKVGPKMTSVLESTDKILKKIEKGEGTLGKLVSDEQLYEDASETLKSAKGAIENVAQFTERIEQVKTYIGWDSAYNEDNAQMLTKLYLRIEPRPHKLYLVGATALTGPGTDWDEKDEADLELDLQLGRRFLNNRLTGRIGLFETRVGAAVDYALNNRLSLSLEGRNTWTKEKDEDIEPFLLRSRLQYKIWRAFHVHAGADNILDDPALNLGVRLEYSDQDIKYMLSTLSIGR